jgi:type IV pilus assembly protein PilQ
MKNLAWMWGVMGFAISAQAGQIQTLQVRTMGEESVVEIIGNRISDFTKQEKASPPQLILTFREATLSDLAKQTFDPSTDTVGSPFVQISSYPHSESDSRIVLDFKKNLKYKIESSEQKVTIRVPLLSEKKTARIAQERLPDLKAPDLDPLTTIISAESEQKFTGSPITLKLRDADVNEVLRLIADTSGFNVIIHPSVTGKLSLSLDQVPWDQALDVVLTTLRLSAERKDSVLRVMPREVLLSEKQAEMDAKQAAVRAAPRITRIFPISYADLSTLQGLLTSFTSAQTSTAGTPATILTNQNTQSLIVRDTAEGVERIKKMIELLDVQTPQVIIEAKVIDAKESFTKSLGGRMSMSFSTNGRSRADFNGGVPAATAGGASGTGNSNQFRFGIGNTVTLDALLAFSETQNNAKVVSSPRVMVMSGKSANIIQGSNVVNSVQNITPTGSQITQTFIPYSTSLGVTPRATNDGSVLLKLNLSRDTVETVSNTSVTAPRSINTEVIVESGSTLVLGGVQSVDETSDEGGFPILRKMPVIGWLFGSSGGNNTKAELVFFVTPRIVNQEKALGIDPVGGEAGKAAVAAPGKETENL